jgi:methyltransferase (TIGR00027 family)
MENETADRVARTARWTAGMRAIESRRPDRLFEDRWAEALAGPEGMDWAQRRVSGGIAPIFALRTRFYDDHLVAVTGPEGCRQVVILAAGLDTRAWRMSWPPSTKLFELDRPSLFAVKDAVLAGVDPACERKTVGVDLRDPWTGPLVLAGFDASLPSAWILEGFLFYLPNADIARILGEVTAVSAPSSSLAFDIVNSATFGSPYTRSWVEMQAAEGAPWQGSMDDPKAVLSALGWDATVIQPGEPEANHGRFTLPVVPQGVPGVPRNLWVRATCR